MALFRSIATVGGWTMGSRVLGFVRDVSIAGMLGAGLVTDAFFVALQLPNIFRRLFAEGAFAQAFVPLFNRRVSEDEDLSDARRFAEEVLAVLIPILVVFGGLALIAMPWIAGLFANEGMDADPSLFDLAVLMARITFPYLVFMSLATLVAAILNSLSRFAAAAAAPILLNLCMISALIVGMTLGGDAEARRQTGFFLAIAVSASGMLQLAWLAFWARRAGFRMRLRAPRLTPGVKEMGVLVLPAILGAGVYQISRFIDLFFLSTLPAGAYVFLAMADRLNQLPLGIVGIALGTAILPSLSRFIAREDSDGAFRLQSNAVELALLLTLPAAVALFVAGSAFTRAFYVGGAFTHEDAMQTGGVVAALVIGLPAYVLVKVLVPNFFARKDTRTPVYTAAISLLLNVALNFYLVPRFGVVGLGLAGSSAAWCNCGLLYAILSFKGFYRLTALVLGRIARIALAAALMGAVLWYALPYGTDFYAGNVLERVGAIAALVALGVAVFFAVAMALRVVDRQTIGQLLRRPA